MTLKPKIIYQSSPRIETCLTSWEAFFQEKRIKYRTDRLFSKSILCDHDISIIFGSWKNRIDRHHQIKNRLIASSLPFIVNETSLLGRQQVGFTFDEDWFRVGVNGFLADSGLFGNLNKSLDRWSMIQEKRKIELLDWNPVGDYILVALQLPGDASLRGASIENWCLQICKEIRLNSSLPIVIRKPQLDVSLDFNVLDQCLSLPDVCIQPGTHANLLKMIDSCIFGCTYTSGIGIDLMLRGKPVVVSDPGSFVYKIRTELVKALEAAYHMPDRYDILNEISYCQWSIEEIKNGTVWNHLMPILEKVVIKKL